MASVIWISGKHHLHGVCDLVSRQSAVFMLSVIWILGKARSLYHLWLGLQARRDFHDAYGLVSRQSAVSMLLVIWVLGEARSPCYL
jgi:hypothetical protein